MVQYAREGGAFGAMTTQLALEELVTRFTQKLPKGGELPMWWIRRLLWQTCESQVIKTEVSVLLIPSSSVGPDRVCLSFLCLLFEMDIPPARVYPILPLDAFWLYHFESMFTVLLLLFLFLSLCIHTIVCESPCLTVQVSSHADSGLGQQYLLHTGSLKPGLFSRVL